MTEIEKALEYNRQLKAALETVYTALNAGQQQKLMKNEKVAALFRRCGLVEESEK